MDQPIESINYWIGYYEDTSYDSEGLLGTIPLIDTVFTLNQFIEKDSEDTLRIEDIARLQLTFAFLHNAPQNSDGTKPWRVANQGGILLGNIVPVEIIDVKTGKSFGVYQAKSTQTHNFEFKWGLDEVVPILPPGTYTLMIHTSQARIPYNKRELVENIFPRKYYPTYRVKIRIPS